MRAYPPAPATGQGARAGALARVGLPVAVFVLALVPFLPALAAGFLNWDDENGLLKNPHYRGLSADPLGWMFTTFHMGHYQPLAWLSLAVDHALWGMNPAGYHATNLLLHAANALLVYALLLALLRRGLAPERRAEDRLAPAAAFGALLFAVHPLRVESVAWVTERRDVLAACFALAAALAHLRAIDAPPSRARAWRIVSVAAFAASLLSKASAVVFPALLLLLDAWPLRRLRRGRAALPLLVEKIPYLVLALAAALLAPLAQQEAGAMRSLAQHGPLARGAQAVEGLVFYLRKTLLPVGLSPLYELPPDYDPSSPLVLASAAALAALVVLLVRARRRFPGGLAAFAAYALLLLPVLGFFQSGPQRVADRYTYLACLPWAGLAAAALADRRIVSAIPAPLRTAGPLAILALLSVLAWRQTRIWKSSIFLWERAVAIDPRSAIAQSNLGTSYDLDAGRLDDAIRHYRLALELRPGDTKTRHSLALAYAKQGRYEPAAAEWSRLLEFDPRHAEALYSLGLAAARLGRSDEALAWTRRAVEAAPSYTAAIDHLGNLLLQRGEREAAKAAWRRALAIAPSDVAARNSLGLALFAEADESGVARDALLGEAEREFRAALAAHPEHADSLNNLGATLSRRGRREEAIALFRRALAIDPRHALARRNLEASTASAPAR